MCFDRAARHAEYGIDGGLLGLFGGHGRPARRGRFCGLNTAEAEDADKLVILQQVKKVIGVGGEKELMAFFVVIVPEHIKKNALQRGVHAKIRLLQKEESTIAELGDNGIGADDQTLHAIAKIVDRMILAVSNLQVDNVID